MSKKTSDVLTGGNMCQLKSGFSAVAAATTLTNVATTVSINGRQYTIAAATATAGPTVDGFTGKAFLPIIAGQSCTFVVTYDKGGVRRVIQGPIGSEADYASGAGALEFPSQIPMEQCPIAYIVARAASTAVGTWTFGTNNHSGVTGVTTAVQDVSWLPSASLKVTD